MARRTTSSVIPVAALSCAIVPALTAVFSRRHRRNVRSFRACCAQRSSTVMPALRAASASSCSRVFVFTIGQITDSWKKRSPALDLSDEWP